MASSLDIETGNADVLSIERSETPLISVYAYKQYCSRFEIIFLELITVNGIVSHSRLKKYFENNEITEIYSLLRLIPEKEMVSSTGLRRSTLVLS